MTLDELMRLPAAMAAFEFRAAAGCWTSASLYPERINETTLDLLAHMCAANMSIATMQARGWEKVTAMKGFYPDPGIHAGRVRLVGGGERLSSEQLKERGKTSLPPSHGCGAGQRKGRL